jgi:hypothetical protein
VLSKRMVEKQQMARTERGSNLLRNATREGTTSFLV